MSILADIAAFANPFGAPSNGEWNLTQGIFTTGDHPPQTIIFFYETKKGEDPSKRTAVDQITDTGGRRVATYEYPYRDGQALADLGRKGESFVFNIKFFGPNYQAKLTEFLDIVNSGKTGVLTHPIRGSVKAKFSTHEFLHRYDESSAVTIKATFMEDNTDTLAATNAPQASADSALRSALQALTSIQASIQAGIFEVGALLLLPAAIVNAMKQRLASITGDFSRLLGQLAATFSNDAQLKKLAAQAANIAGGIPNLSSGTTQGGTGTGGSGIQTQLPPVFQVGFDPVTQASINAQVASFVNSNQITPQQAVFATNQIRTAISAAIADIETNFGNDGSDLVIQYRALSVSMQQAVESAIASTQSLVKLYITPRSMSLRKIAFENSLSPDRQNDIEALNPYLASVNYVPAQTQLVVPAS